MSSRSASPRLLRSAPPILIGLLFCTGALAQLNKTEFPALAPTGITVGPDGAIWYADNLAKQIVRIDGSGVVTAFPAPSSPHSIASGPDGNLWYTAWDGRIGRMTTSGTTTEFTLAHAGSGVGRITPGPDGSLWFIESGANRIGRITTSGAVTEFPVPTANAGLADITSGPDGNLWFTEQVANKIGRITTSGAVTEFDLPRTESLPNRIVTGSDGNLWFSEYYYSPTFNERAGRITPTGEIAEFSVPGGANEIGAGTDGNLWLGSFESLHRMTTNGSLTTIPVSWVWPVGIAAAPDGAIWVASGYDAFDGINGGIVRFSTESLHCEANPFTLCLGDGRFRVTADWKAGDGSTGHGHGVNLTANSGYFWFFEAANIETVVKVLDGCPANQHQWVFATGLTNVGVTTTVTDTYNGLRKAYTNLPGTPFVPIQDTAAFACQ